MKYVKLVCLVVRFFLTIRNFLRTSVRQKQQLQFIAVVAEEARNARNVVVYLNFQPRYSLII